MTEVFKVKNIPQEYIDAFIESEKLEAMGKMEYVTQEELIKQIEKIFEDYDKSKVVWIIAYKTLYWKVEGFILKFCYLL